VKACAEGCAVDQFERQRVRAVLSGNNPNISDANRSRPEHPDRSSVAALGRRDRQTVDTKRLRKLFGYDAVRHQRGDRAVISRLHINRAQFDESIECFGADGQVDSVRHASA
jgi:hypothetical protein